MPADPRLTNAAASAAADAVVDRIDTGGAGTIKIYTGTIPTDADTAVGAQTLLATLTFSATASPWSGEPKNTADGSPRRLARVSSS